MSFEATKNFRKKATSDTTDTGSNAASGRFEATSNFRRNEAYAQRRYNEMERQVNDIISRYNGIIKQAQEYTSGGEKKSATPNIRYRAGDTIGGGNDYTDFSTAYSLGRSAAKLRKEASELMSTIQGDYGSGNTIEKLAAVQVLNSIANESFDDEISNEFIGRMPYTSYNVRKQALRQYLDDKKIEKKYGINDDTSAIELIGKAEGITVPKAAAERQEASADAKKAYSEEKSRIEKEYGITLSYDDYEENVLKLQELMKTLPAGEEKQRVLDFSKIDPTIYNYKMTAGGSDTPTAEEKKKQQKFEATERTGYNYIEADRDTLQKEKDYLRYLASQRITMDDWNAINEGEAYTDDVARDYKVSAIINDVMSKADFEEKSKISDEEKETLRFDPATVSVTDQAKNFFTGINYDDVTAGMSDDEIKVFNYLLNTGDRVWAEDFRSRLNKQSEFYEDIGSRKGREFYEKNLKGHPILTALYSVPAGFMGQFVSNMQNLDDFVLGTTPDPKEHSELSAIEAAKQDHGALYNVLLDLGVNLGDNAPSWIIGGAAGAAAKGFGAAVKTAQGIANTASAGTMFLSAGSAAYSQAIEEGYSAKQAQNYGVITGLSEAFLEKALGGIAGMGGKITGKSVEAAIKNIEKAGLRMLAEGTIDMAGEFTEEYLQEILDPVFRNITLDENNEFKPFTADALYAGMLGALSAATVNAGPLAIEAISYAKNKAQRAAGTVRTGQELIGTEAAQQMVELGKEIGKDRLVEKATADVKERRGLGKIVQFVEKTKKAAANGKLAESVVTDTLRKAESVASEELTQRLGDLGQKKDVVVTMALAMAANDTDTQDAMNALIIQSLSAEEYQKTIAAVGETADVLHKKTNIEQVAKVDDSIDRGDYDMENIPLTSQEIKAVRRDGDGNITYIGRDGQEVSSEDVKISAELKYFYEKYAAKLPEADAEEMITAFKKSKLPDYAAPYFAAEWKHAREMGRLGVSSERLSEVEMNLDLDTITKDYIKKAAYAQGLKERAKAVHLDNVQKKAEKIIQNRRSGKAEGEVRGTDTLHKSQDKRSAKNVLRIAEVLAKLGYDIEFYSGKKTINGVETRDTVNGAYVASTHTIYLRADASYSKRTSVRGILGFTLAHELTHSLKEGDLKGYQELVEYITASLGTKTFENLMSRYMYTQDGKENMKYSAALDEVVANACEKMLENSKALEKLAMENAPLYLKVGEKLKNLIRRIRNSLKGMYSDVDSLHPETAELMKALGDKINEFQQMYDRVLYDSITNMRNALAEAENAKTRENLNVLEKQAEKEGLQLSEEIGDRYADYDKPITVYDVEVLRSIGRKSINSFTSEDIQKAAKWAYKFYKELGTKSPFFRAWFGDWRAKDRNGVKVVDTAGYTKGQKVYNEDTSWDINVNRQVGKETSNHRGKNEQSAVKYLPYIDDITKKAVLLGTESSDDSNVNSLLFHSMYAYTEVLGYPALLKLQVEELFYNSRDESGIIHRDYILQNIEEEQLPRSKQVSSLHHLENGSSTITVSDLYSFVKRFDKDFTAAHEVNPALLNEDGTPKVLYHYTDNVFSIFDISRSGANQGKTHGDGIYLSSNPNEFSYAGKNRMQLYASIANPFEMQLSKAEAEKIYDKYFKPFHKDTYNTYKPHVIDKLQSPTRVFDYLNEAAEKNNVKTGDILSELGYDGVHDGPEWVAFKETQVKSATDNIGTFDKGNDDIQLSEELPDSGAVVNPSEKIPTSDEAYTAADWRRDAAEAMEFVAKTDTEKAFALMYADAVRATTEAEAEINEINAKLREAKKFGATNEQLESIGKLTEQKKQALERKREAGEKLLVYQKYGTYTKLMARAEKTNLVTESVDLPPAQSYAKRRRDAVEADTRRALLSNIAKRSDRIIRLASDNSRTKHIPTTQKELIGRLGLGTEINTLTRTALLADQRERMLVSIADAENRLAKYRDDLKRYTERKNNMLEKLKGNLTEKQRANAESSVEYYEQFEGRRTVQIEAAEKQIENFRKRLESLEASSRAMDEFTKNLYDIYESFKGESDKNGGSNAVYDTDIGEALKEFKDRNSGRSVLEMSTADLRSLDNLLAAVSASISNADKVFKAGRNATVSGYAEQVRGEVGTAEKSVKDNRFSQAAYSAGEWIKKQLFKPAERFKQTGSGTLYKMYRRLQHGEGDYARSVIKYGKFFKDQIEKYGIKEADLGKKITETVTDTRYVDGKATKEYKQVTLTVGQIMTMYGLSLRKLGLQHLVAENGGFRLEGKRLLTEKAYIVNAKAFTLDADGVHTLTSKLSNEQKEFVKALQGYMSTEMAKDRNKVTLEMYDYEGATEKNYWPIITDSSYRVKNMEKKNDRSVQLKNIGSMKETNPMATSPVILQSIETLWANHANETALYSSFTLELENIKRVLDYEFENGDAVKRLLGDKQSDGLFEFLNMVNGGIRADDVGMMKLFNRYKAAKVGANLRVVIQQPTAIVRALALIGPKYLFGSFNTSKTLTKDMGMKLEEEAMEYTSTYGIKSLGGIDIGTKGSLSEQLSDFGKNKSIRKKAESFKEKAFYGMAEQADRVTWLALWNACKREQHDLHPELSGEALLKAAGERFDEITNETQVYDSVFSRARILSSESSYARMLTSFFAEPLTTLNMAIEGVSQIVKGNAKKGARYLASVAGAIILTNMFSSVFDALRDDDDDQSFGEKYVEALLSSLINDFNPAAYIPFYRDLLNIIQGYDAKRADMQLVSDIINRTRTIVTKWDTEKGIRNFAELWQQEVKLGSNILDALGIPMTNIWRDASALLRLPETLKVKATKTGWKSAMEDFKTEVPFYGWRRKGMKAEDKLYYATLNKDSAYLERAVGNLTKELEGKGKSKKEIRSAIDQKIKKGLQDNDLRIAAAAQARIEGDTEEYLSCVNAVVNDGFTEKQTVSAILALENELNGDDEGVDRYISGIPYTKTDIQRELEAGNTAPLEEFYAQKFTEKSAEDDVKNPAKEARQAAANMLGNIYSEPYKRAYDDGDTDECERITELLLDVEIEGHRLLKYKTIVGWKDKKLSDDEEEEE